MLTNFQNILTVVFSMKFATSLCHISYHTLMVLLHYLAQFKRPKLAKFCWM